MIPPLAETLFNILGYTFITMCIGILIGFSIILLMFFIHLLIFLKDEWF